MPDRAQKLLINVPYDMVRPRMERIVSLRIGVEVYLSNEAVNEIDRQDARELGRELEDRGITCTVHAPFMDLCTRRRRQRDKAYQPGKAEKKQSR